VPNGFRAHFIDRLYKPSISPTPAPGVNGQSTGDNDSQVPPDVNAGSPSMSRSDISVWPGLLRSRTSLDIYAVMNSRRLADQAPLCTEMSRNMSSSVA
jgi:hypothetical protein